MPPATSAPDAPNSGAPSTTRTPANVAPMPAGLREKLVACWGILGVSVLLVQAIVRLTPIAWEPMRDGSMGSWHWALWAGWLVGQGYMEGYRGFQQRFCPRVMARAAYLGRNPRPLWVLLAWPFCMTLFHAPRPKLIARYIFLFLLISLIVSVKFVPQPWRGIIDAGVVLGLAWGLLYLWWLLARYLAGHGAPEPIDIPAPAGDAA